MSRFVLDASVVLAWCFPDENPALAQQVATRFSDGHTAVAPSFWPHEVLNALLAGERRKRISENLIRAFLVDLSALPVELAPVPAGDVFNRIHALARDHRLTAYDAAYLDLALDNQLRLATLDDDLSEACVRAGGKLIQNSN